MALIILLQRYVDPIVVFVNEMVTHRKFKTIPQHEVNQLVTYEKGASPQQIPYYFTAPKEHPGRFEITYMPSAKLKHEVHSIILMIVTLLMDYYSILLSILRASCSVDTHSKMWNDY